MRKIILGFMIIYPFIFIPGYYNYTIYKFVALSLLSIVLLILFLLQFLRNFGKKPFKITLAEVLLLIYLLLITLSTVFSVDPAQALSGGSNRYEGFTAYLSYILLFIFSFRSLKTEKIVLFLKTLVFLSLVIAVYGILQHYLIDPLPRILSKVGWTRSYGFFGNPDFYGSFITLLLPLILIFFFIERPKYAIIYLITADVNFLVLLFSQTRSGWLGSFVAFCLLMALLFFYNKKYWKKILIVSLTFLIIFGAVNVKTKQSVTTRITGTITQVQSDVNKGGSDRIFIWRTTLPLISNYYLIGSGPDTLGLVFPNGTAEVAKYMGNAYVDKAHNNYLEIAVTLGIPALLVYLAFLTEVVRKGIQSLPKQNEKKKLLTYALLSAIAGYILQDFFNISVITIAPYFWIVLAITYKLSHRDMVIN